MRSSGVHLDGQGRLAVVRGTRRQTSVSCERHTEADKLVSGAHQRSVLLCFETFCDIEVFDFGQSFGGILANRLFESLPHYFVSAR